jgi:hypothetical protein
MQPTNEHAAIHLWRYLGSDLGREVAQLPTASAHHHDRVLVERISRFAPEVNRDTESRFLL